ncbi:hypothetical protein PCE1_001779 [Barthelona sp. PCE]
MTFDQIPVPGNAQAKLYLGPFGAIRNREDIESLDTPFTFVVNVAPTDVSHEGIVGHNDTFESLDVLLQFFKGQSYVHYRLEEVLPVIWDKLMNGESVFVHCQLGITRSATLIAALLMKYCNLDYRSAVNHVTSYRHIVDISGQHRALLIQYGEFLKKN